MSSPSWEETKGQPEGDLEYFGALAVFEECLIFLRQGLTMQPSKPSCLCFLSSGILDVHLHGWPFVHHLSHILITGTKFLTSTTKKERDLGWGCSSAAQCLPGNWEVLSSSPSTKNRKKRGLFWFKDSVHGQPAPVWKHHGRRPRQRPAVHLMVVRKQKEMGGARDKNAHSRSYPVTFCSQALPPTALSAVTSSLNEHTDEHSTL